MKFEEIITLIDKVAKSGLTFFSYEEEGSSLVLKAPEYQSESVTCVPTKTVKECEISEEPEKVLGKATVSPLVGIFYESSTPGGEPFVKAGDQVTKGQVLGIVEAMKLMNEIESEHNGTIREILVKNGDMVEFDQPLFIIE